MRAYFQYKEEVIKDGYKTVYKYYKLDNGEWLVDTPVHYCIPGNFDRLISPIFSKDMDKIKEYDYDIRQILLDDKMPNIKTEYKTPIVLSHTCPWSGQIMTTDLKNL